MSNPTVSFRISDYHLARGLRAVRAIEPAWKMTSTSNLIRTIFNDYIAKSEHLNNMPLAVPPALLQEIAQSRTGANKQEQAQPDIIRPLGQQSAQQIQRDLEDERIFNEIKQEAIRAKQISAAQTEKQIATIMQEAPSELSTGSVVTTVKDFSPPKEWTDSES